MDIYAALPNGGAEVSLQNVLEMGDAAEELGFKGVMALDHLLVPREIAHRYGQMIEPLVLLGYIAGRTRSLRLGVSVIVIPMRNPFAVALQAATLDHLSGGRFIMGVGVGWSEGEFRNVGAAFHTRGARTDEAVRLFRHLWSGSQEPFEGRFNGYEDGVFGLPPPQRDKLPILIGGNSDAALRRAARLGDIWQSTAIGVDDFAVRAERLQAMAGDRQLEMGARTALQGSPDEQLAEIDRWRAAGAQHLLLSLGTPERMRAFATDVLAGVAS
jgi:probable F420-dependent oxidoreductase